MKRKLKKKALMARRDSEVNGLAATAGSEG